jgi:hypothetical protein
MADASTLFAGSDTGNFLYSSSMSFESGMRTMLLRDRERWSPRRASISRVPWQSAGTSARRSCSRWRTRNRLSGRACVTQGGQHAGRREWYVAQPRARRVEHGVADRRRDERDRCFPCAGRRYACRRHEHGLDRGHVVVEVQARVRRPVDRCDPALVPRDLLDERAARALEQATFDGDDVARPIVPPGGCRAPRPTAGMYE